MFSRGVCMKALILNNKVVDLNEHTFDVAPPLHWVDAPNETTIGDLYENGQIKIIRISDEEKAEKQLRWLRKERDKLLRASDWTQYNDVTLDSDKKTEWVTYRQALRDITVSFSSVSDENFAWPTKPE